LHRYGLSNRQLAAIGGHAESEVSEIMHAGRQVNRYDLLERIADCFGIPRGRIGLAGDYPNPAAEPDKNEDVRRRKFLSLAAAAAIGGELPKVNLGDEHRLWEVHRLGRGDITMLDTMVGRLRDLDQEFGGVAGHDSSVALLRRATGLLDAQMSELTRSTLLSFLAHTHSFVGWSASDAGDSSLAKLHFQHSLMAGQEAQDHAAIARTLHLAARDELLWGEPNEALKLFQLAEPPTEAAGSTLLQSTIKADSAIVLARSGHTSMARSAAGRAREYLAAVDFATDPAPWFQASDVTSALSAAKFHAGDRDEAITEISDALLGTHPHRIRSRAFRCANLVEFHLTAGNRCAGIEAGRTALELAANVRSARLPVRLAPAAAAADHYRRDTDARELATAIRALG
ncbi:MAG: hypothetical protein ACRDQ5_16800, partial [Sciscionella sp.]